MGDASRLIDFLSIKEVRKHKSALKDAFIFSCRNFLSDLSM